MTKINRTENKIVTIRKNSINPAVNCQCVFMGEERQYGNRKVV